MKQSAKRRLKIQPKHIARSYNRYVIFPEIRLCGKWLQKIGFNYGSFVTIEHQQNKIIITANNEIEGSQTRQ
ncbi:type I addiction module toxin, SymE family [Flavobacterium sp. ANB]|uniref:SymE family type I addiction module toxin n=1 Tax=unclassified Flavobacterium TaxID=196869 RepID=UPI0012B9B876|nr:MULTISPECIES: SymE family type I addiction module toxin [unclassified Flavobacterium]MBF4517815.1 type I addiction module toxin, SymE family [Flavobacterium sp. ANB]MTD70542.1 type I addiction module toxin, SymE family [Flavobacterium sp. LC2016-13]